MTVQNDSYSQVRDQFTVSSSSSDENQNNTLRPAQPEMRSITPELTVLRVNIKTDEGSSLRRASADIQSVTPWSVLRT